MSLVIDASAATAVCLAASGFALLREARRLAVSLGWAKTYDAEYVALARLSREPLLTVDVRLARRVRDLIEVRLPADL